MQKMFTGIITHRGTVRKNSANQLTVTAPAGFIRPIKIGDSIAVSGICLTVIVKTRTSFTIQYIPETRRKTTITRWKTGDTVNLERAAKAGSRLDGHIVQGHIDATGTVKRIAKKGNSRILTIALPASLRKYIVAKGSITVDGVSLTVMSVGKNMFTVDIIPHTAKVTTLGARARQDRVNIETDILAKYAKNR